ncbi:hypothetical protein GSI_08986 [Ganoderma sinense ZZ0214-1]|uniref:F-box domain-containing protein n=1 Tax=Ganoderma sinense ZZ0214-1 TaxID=1077348 RepID=A0A2G8S575_9APHY|nr:hypothetical protein GSI_08986 [Ganoderma sinense ZZ0214-1]
MVAFNDQRSVSRTHHLWFIDEILRNILSQLPSGSHSTLASCARVSKALSEPALDALWYKISGLVPLFRLLPRSFAETRNQMNDGVGFVIQGAIEDEEWARFLRYSERVRKLHYHYAEGPGERLGERPFSALVQHASRSGTTVLPNLQEVFWLQFSHVAQCLPFLSRSLRRVTLYVQAASPTPPPGVLVAHIVPSPMEGYGGLFGVLEACSPCLEELSLEGIDFRTSWPLSSPTIFKHLRALHLGSISTPPSVIVSYCSRMPRLVSLSVVFRRSSGWSKSEPWRSQHGDQCQDPPQLSALEVVRIAGAPFDIEDILHAVNSPLLHTAALSVAISDRDTDGWTRCATLLSARFSRSLRTVRAECMRSGMVVPSHARSFSQYVQPLLPLRRLQDCTITIEDPAGVALTDEDVVTMASSWTSLSTLEVSLNGGTSGLPRPTFSSLLVFVHRCPGLVTLRLPFGQHLASLSSDDDWSTVRSRADLRELWISGASFSRRDTDILTRFLRHLFPKVNLVPLINVGVLHVV